MWVTSKKMKKSGRIASILPLYSRLKECVEKYDDVTIVALAPLTNVAMFLKTYPHLKHLIKEKTIMRGSLYGGNILPRSEFNLYADPHAAHIVFQSGCPITLAPIEICQEVAIFHEEIDQLAFGGQLVSYPMIFFSSFHFTIASEIEINLQSLI